MVGGHHSMAPTIVLKDCTVRKVENLWPGPARQLALWYCLFSSDVFQATRRPCCRCESWLTVWLQAPSFLKHWNSTPWSAKPGDLLHVILAGFCLCAHIPFFFLPSFLNLNSLCSWPQPGWPFWKPPLVSQPLCPLWSKLLHSFTASIYLSKSQDTRNLICQFHPE